MLHNENIGAEFGVTGDILEHVKEMLLKWCGHVKRLSNNRKKRKKE